MVEVLNSYDCYIGLAELQSYSFQSDLSGETDISIDNRKNKEVCPEIIITGDITVTSIENDDGDKITFDTPIDLDTNDILTVDFNEQYYNFYDNSLDTNESQIDNITINELVSIKANKQVIFTVTCTGTGTITFNYDKYQEESQLHYVESFMINKELNFKKVKPYYSNKFSQRNLKEKVYTFTLNKMFIDWLDEEKEYSIRYRQFNEDTLFEEEKYLTGVKFNKISHGFNNPNEIIKKNLSGEAMDILTKTN